MVKLESRGRVEVALVPDRSTCLHIALSRGVEVSRGASWFAAVWWKYSFRSTILIRGGYGDTGPRGTFGSASNRNIDLCSIWAVLDEGRCPFSSLRFRSVVPFSNSFPTRDSRVRVRLKCFLLTISIEIGPRIFPRFALSFHLSSLLTGPSGRLPVRR